MMNRFAWLALVLAVTAGWNSNDAFARGGAGPRGGNFERGGSFERDSFDRGISERLGGEKRQASQRQETQRAQSGQNRSQDKATSRANSVQNRASNFPSRAATASRPFSSGWYGSHPNAWRATHPYAGAWGAVGLGTAAAWLGIGGYDDDTDDTYVDGTMTSDDGTDDDDDNQTDDAAEVSNPPAAPQNPQADEVLPAADTNWLPLGVFSIQPENQTNPAAVVQLAVDKQGTLNGTYYDVVSDQGQPVQGSINKEDQVASWTVGPDSPVQFRTTLTNLTQNNGEVRLQYANGWNRTWSLTRLQDQSNAK